MGLPMGGVGACIPFTHQSGVKVAFGSAVGRMPACRITRTAKSQYLYSIWLGLTVLAQSF